MKVKLLKRIILALIFFSLFLSSFIVLVEIFSLEVDKISRAIQIKDGDTFHITSSDEIRLADINAPELGQKGSNEAFAKLSKLIYDKRVYLDIDDLHKTDNYGRLVCLVYIDYNTTHYLNVNQELLESKVAQIWEHENEFNPYSWNLFEPKLTANERNIYLGISALVSLGSIFLLYQLYRILRNLVHSGTSARM